MGRNKRHKPRTGQPSRTAGSGQGPRPPVTLQGFGPEDYDNVIQATADLCERAGARGFEIGFLHDDVPAEDAAWFAAAQFRGARKIAENHRGPADAAFALAADILTGGKCRCGKLVSLTEGGAIAYGKSHLAHGLGEWTAQQAQAAGQCRWRLVKNRWQSSCNAPSLTLPGSR
ncbi:hypothetical protein [Streptomyces violaceusniger]|uniref:Uncharacterized protein n=1 Tax=Streptomyces violaceusniger (strain Tu 4113) TaxID=653045 RepID=G2PI03_STRV4|nr:hypothetical protein [Streptomyces violaceusniger]AEM88954.1 hypothetical protein Strvi_0181 [Streptomyces violaceusniger Tu 4113]